MYDVVYANEADPQWTGLVLCHFRDVPQVRYSVS